MSNTDSISDQVRESAQRIAQSGVPALSGLYDLTAQRLTRLAVTITRNQHDAEDAVQAVLVRVVGNVQLLDRADCPWSYLLRMVRNEALAVLRRKRRWTLAALSGLTNLNNLTDLLVRRSVDELEQEDTYRAIWLALRKLPIEQSEVVVLKIWEELTFLQIAEILSVPAATAASRYRYALQKLSCLLGQQSAEVRHE